MGDLGSIPGLERTPGEGKGYPLQYSDLENSMESQRVRYDSDFHFHFLFMIICTAITYSFSFIILTLLVFREIVLMIQIKYKVHYKN